MIGVTSAQPVAEDEKQKKQKKDLWDQLLTGLDLAGSAASLGSDVSKARDYGASQAAKGSGFQNDAMQRRINRTA